MARALQSRRMIDDINVTPLVDIALVLLVIFMVTAKLVTSPSIPMDLPKAGEGRAVASTFTVTVAEDGTLAMGGRSIDDGQLAKSAAEVAQRRPVQTAVIAADGDVSHRRIIGVLDILRRAGLEQVAFSIRVDDAG